MKSVIVALVLFASLSALSANQEWAYQWGQAGDIPVAGDYDGDKIADIVVYRAGTWYFLLSSRLFNVYRPVTIQWGQAGDVPMPGDYDGDGVTDLAVFRPSTGVWYIAFSNHAPGH